MGVFEVVRPKIEPSQILYREPLPKHLLPFHERNDKYDVVGTAFALEGVGFISAAHVFQLPQNSANGEMLIRDGGGRIYKIKQITGYSEYRDLIKFTLETKPAQMKPLTAGKLPVVGDTVYTFGNALAQGNAFRLGNVSSFSPEPVNGAWPHIRFSAAASPGNSGGPLLDAKGNVAGVVVMKSPDENLNYAVPISEVHHFGKNADFLSREMGEFESGFKHIYEWRAELPLPATRADLAKASQAQLIKDVEKQRAVFEKKFHDEIFPYNKRLMAFMGEQKGGFLFGMVDRTAEGRWEHKSPDYKRVEVSPNQTVFVGALSHSSTFFSMERGEKQSVQQLLTHPQLVVDAITASLKIERPFAGSSVRVKSYGKPKTTESWTDSLGRYWIFSVWHLYNDAALVTQCTPYPRGVACVIYDSSTGAVPLTIRNGKLDAHRLMLGYDGRVKDWLAFQKLPKEMVPKVLAGTQVGLTPGMLSLSMADFKGVINHADISEESLLYVEVNFGGFSPVTQRIDKVQLSVSSHHKGWVFDIAHYIKATDINQKKYRDLWDRIESKNSPFDGKVVTNGDTRGQWLVGESSPLSIDGKSYPAKVFHHCAAPKDVSESDLDKNCKSFQRSFSYASN